MYTSEAVSVTICYSFVELFDDILRRVQADFVFIHDITEKGGICSSLRVRGGDMEEE